MILSGPGRVADDELVTEFFRQATPPRIDLSQILVAERRGRVLWATLPVLSPGRTALLLSAPAPGALSDSAAAAALIELTCKALKDSGIHLAQALIEPADQRSQALFQAHRFTTLAELIYLAASPRKKQSPPQIPDGMFWVSYEAGPVHNLFKQTISKSYENSLDCPALNGLRDLEDVMAGHRASGEFSPKLWRLLCLPPAIAGGEPDPLGVLLLSRVPAAQSVELVYLGLVPDARRRKLGDLLVRHALAAVAAEGMQRLTLAVDSKNSPALTVYYRNGLSKVGSKLATLRDLRTPDDPPLLSTAPGRSTATIDASSHETAIRESPPVQ